jgi:hypothetical protein
MSQCYLLQCSVWAAFASLPHSLIYIHTRARTHQQNRTRIFDASEPQGSSFRVRSTYVLGLMLALACWWRVIVVVVLALAMVVLVMVELCELYRQQFRSHASD